MAGDDINILGLRIDRKTDVIALTAFIIAILGTFLQIANWTRGPRVVFHAPARILVYLYLQPNGYEVVRIAAPMSYTNTAPAEYSGILKMEKATIKIGDFSSEQIWASFGRLSRAEERFSPQIYADAAPIPVPGGGAVSHTTLFTAVPRDCSAGTKSTKCDTYGDYIFRNKMTKALGDAKTIEFTFTAEIYDEKPQTAQCEATVDPEVVSQWLANRWLTVPCRLITGND